VKSHGEAGTNSGHTFVDSKRIPVQTWVSLNDNSMLGVGATATGLPLYTFQYTTNANLDDESASHFKLVDPKNQISRKHLSIEFKQASSTFKITDHTSKNGTWVSMGGSVSNCLKIASKVPQPLQVGETVVTGGYFEDRPVGAKLPQIFKGVTAFRLMER